MKLFNHFNTLYGQDLRETLGVLPRDIIMVKQPTNVLSQIMSLLMARARQRRQDLSVDLLIDYLDMWQDFNVRIA